MKKCENRGKVAAFFEFYVSDRCVFRNAKYFQRSATNYRRVFFFFFFLFCNGRSTIGFFRQKCISGRCGGLKKSVQHTAGQLLDEWMGVRDHEHIALFRVLIIMLYRVEFICCSSRDSILLCNGCFFIVVLYPFKGFKKLEIKFACNG